MKADVNPDVIPEIPESEQYTSTICVKSLGIRTKKALGRALSGQKCPNRFLIKAVMEIQQAIIDAQNQIVELHSLLTSSAHFPENFEYMEEAPLRKFFQGINTQIATLGINAYQFDFVYQEEITDGLTHSLFEELVSYQNHLEQVHIHQGDSFLEDEDFTRIPLAFGKSKTIGYFSFPKSRNTCLLQMEEMAKVVTFIMNMIRSLLNFLELKKRSGQDPLTCIPNRGLVMEKANTLVHIASRDDVFISFFLIDLDYFKKINDTYGHPIGDEVLIKVSKALQDALRQEDTIGRFGGEEFLVVAKHATMEENLSIANRLLDSIRSIIVKAGGDNIQPTCSIGIYTEKPAVKGLNADTFIQSGLVCSDDALYKAKAGGRNQAVQYSINPNHTPPLPVLLEKANLGQSPIN